MDERTGDGPRPFYDTRTVSSNKGITYMTVDSSVGLSKDDMVDLEIVRMEGGSPYRRTTRLVYRGNSLTATLPITWGFSAGEWVYMTITPRYTSPAVRNLREDEISGDQMPNPYEEDDDW